MLAVLEEEYGECRRCTLGEDRGDGLIVFGDGSPTADVLIVTDPPDEEDVHTGVPLTAESGHLFVSLLKEAGLNPKKAYATNVVACRPFVVIPKTEESDEVVQNRTPSKDEISACSPRLEKLIYTIDPRLIIAAGDLAWKALVASRDRTRQYTKISNAQGNLFHTWVPGKLELIRYPVLALLSPAAIINNPGSSEHGPMNTTRHHAKQALSNLNWITRSDRGDTNEASSFPRKV